MTKARRILLITGMLVAGVTSAHASLWRRGADKAPAQPAAAAAPAGISLTAVDVETTPAPRLILRTSASPVYTSYNRTPDTFVIDLTGTSRAASVVAPTALPSSVSGVTVDEVTEMGTRLTRVTVHLNERASIEAAADGNRVIVTLPADAAPAPAVAAIPDATQAPAAAPAAAAPAKVEEQPPVETKIAAVSAAAPVPAPAVSEPPVVTEALPATKAKTLRKIETSGSGAAMEVRLATDGDVAYNAFKLEKPRRVVIDLNGVTDKLARNIINVSDPVVKRIRVSQFKSAPEPVTRVVLDIDETAKYQVAKSGDALRITFDDAPSSAPIVAEAPAPMPRVKAATVAETPKPVPARSEMAVVAPQSETAPAKSADDIPVVVASKAPAAKATARIDAPQAQPQPSRRGRRSSGSSTSTPAPAPAPAPAAAAGENVFSDPQQPAVGSTAPAPQPAPVNGPSSTTGTVLSTGTAAQGGRTLSGGQRVYTGEPLSLNLKDADIKDVLRTFAQLTGLNIAVDPQVTGSVTVDFVDVPWDQALDIILRQNGLAYVLEGNVMRIGTAERLASEAESGRRLAEQERLNVPLTTVGFKLSYARASDVQALLRDMASPRARIIVDARTNQLIISEIPNYLQTMQNLIASVDVPTRQVLIEARIVETTKSFIQQYGFNWGARGSMDPSLGTGTGLVFPNRVDFVGGPFNFGVGNPVLSFSLQNVLGTFTLDLALLAAESEGLVRVISAPRVMTQDNSPAEIQSGFQIPYQTRVNFTTTVSYVDATLRLSVTPQITEAGTVIMDIQVQKNEPATGLNIVGGAGTPLSTRRAQTRLMVRDGGTSVIAGIYQVKENNGQSRLPVLHSIPILGALFRARDYNTEHDELLIFITPRIVRAS